MNILLPKTDQVNRTFFYSSVGYGRNRISFIDKNTTYIKTVYKLSVPKIKRTTKEIFYLFKQSTNDVIYLMEKDLVITA